MRWLFSVHVLRWKFWTVGTSVFICDFSEQFSPEYHIIKYTVLCWLYSNYNVYYVQKQTSCVLVLYKYFCVFIAHKSHKIILKISDSEIITFYTNTTPPLADFAKKISPPRKFSLKIYRRKILLAFYLLYLQNTCKNKC